jgi:hypothetical protein
MIDLSQRFAGLVIDLQFRRCRRGCLRSLSTVQANSSFSQPGPFGPPAGQIPRPEILDLEPAITQAELILAARLVDVTETKIVHGGRNVQITEQFRFEPVRVLKGIFARESLLMTGDDLGIYRFADATDRLARGQLMLVLLGRQGRNSFNCNGAPTLAQSIPRLESKNEPLLPAVAALISTTRMRDRAARVTTARDGLRTATGRAVAPLLLSLSRRAGDFRLPRVGQASRSPGTEI